MRWRPLALGLLTAVLLGMAAATITTPQAGALDPNPIDRNPSAGDSSPDPSDPDGAERPGISLPGIGLTIPLPSTDLPGWLRIILLGAGLAVGAMIVFRLLRGPGQHEQLEALDPDDAMTHSTEESAPGDDTGGVGLLESANADVDNEVYRAWMEMIRLVDVERPESRSPGEIREAAVAAGAEPDNINTLIDEFVAVRYGSRPVTSDRRQSVAAALKRVRATLREPGESVEASDTAESGLPSRDRPNQDSTGGRGPDRAEDGETE